jgi:hypothetical protein
LPTIFPFDFGEEPADTQSMVSINCGVTKGDLPMIIKWLFNGKELNSGDNDVIITKSGQRNSMLSIEAVNSNHVGNYTCVARNKAGFVQHSSELKVIGTFD